MEKKKNRLVKRAGILGLIIREDIFGEKRFENILLVSNNSIYYT